MCRISCAFLTHFRSCLSSYMTQIWLPHCKYESHSNYAKLAYRSNIFSHTYQNNTTCNSSITHNAKYMPGRNMPLKCHMLYISCADMRQLWQCIYFMYINYNQQCEQDHYYTYISHYWHINLNKYACHI